MKKTILLVLIIPLISYSQRILRPSGTTDIIHGLSFLDANNGMACGDPAGFGKQLTEVSAGHK